MASEHRHPADPITFAGGVLDRYRHVCAFMDGLADDAVLDPFIAQGIDHGDRLLYVVDPAASAAPVTHIRHLGYDAGRLLEEHRCEVRTWSETYLQGGGFDQGRMLDHLDRMLGAGDSPRIRMLCDMGWAVDRPGIAESLIRFEARANFIHARHEHVVICSYDATRFDGSFVIDILRTHPMVLIGGILQENPFFVPPSEFLRERSATPDA